jgi:beta-glucosidase-like glycosyl hydrolase
MMKKAFQLGLFDDPDQVPYANYGPERLDTPEHRQLALDGATQSIVLLKNDPVPPSTPVQPSALAMMARPLLPLAPSTKVAIVGPHFNASLDMLSNYHGENHLVFNHTPLLAMQRSGNVVGSAKGSGLWQPDESGFAEAVAVAAKADVAVVFVGLHPQWFDSANDGDAREGEDLDRENITLPDVQLKLLQVDRAC